MTNQQILKKAIEKAKKDKLLDKYGVSGCLSYIHWNLVFSHGPKFWEKQKEPLKYLEKFL